MLEIRKTCWTALLCVLGVLCSSIASAANVDLADEDDGLLGRYVQFLHEGVSAMDLQAARQTFAQAQFIAAGSDALNLGIGIDPVWLRLEVNNSTGQDVPRFLSLETSWLDDYQLYFVHRDGTIQRHQMGDALPFFQRPIADRFFVVEHTFSPGITEILMRVETPDPLLLPLRLTTREQRSNLVANHGYHYGLLYGALLALLLYNLMFFFSLRNNRYLYYSAYIFSFILLNATYTGHSYWYLWPDWPQWQRWSNPVLMTLYAVAGFAFAVRFLRTRLYFPQLHRAMLIGCAALVLLQLTTMIADSQFGSVLIAFIVLMAFFVVMIFLGVVAHYGGNRSARYFLLASVIGSASASVTTATTWGLIPYSVNAYRAIDIGMVIEAVILALALANEFRVNQQKKIKAESEARMDPLTKLNNRRAFLELTEPFLTTPPGRSRDLAVIMLDMDHFKQVNDTYGHPFGDQVLVQLAKLLEDGARQHDVLARWGGEEFIVCLPETSLADAVFVAERIRREASSLELVSGGQAIRYTISVGVAHSDSAYHSIGQLIEAADRQLYKAKANGRNQVRSTLDKLTIKSV